MEDLPFYDIEYQIADGCYLYLKKYSTRKLGVVCPVDICNDFDGWKKYKNQIPIGIDIPKEIKLYGSFYEVESISDNAFFGCEQLLRIYLPNTIIHISESAFWGCSKSLSIYKSNRKLRLNEKIFSACTLFDDRNKGDIISKISVDKYFGKEFHLRDCIGNLPIEIESEKNINIPKQNTTNSQPLNYNCIDINDRCPLYFKKLKEGECCVEIPLKEIGDKEVKFPSVKLPFGKIVIPEEVDFGGEKYKVTILGTSAFYNCQDVESIELSNTIREIKTKSLTSCINLQKLIISQSVQVIEDAFLYGCSPIIINNSKNFIWKDGLLLTKNGKKLIFASSSLVNVDVPSTVDAIGNYAFKNCKQLKNVKLPQSIISIGEGAFCGCDYLYQINIPNSIKKIADDTFSGCIRLENLVLPDTIKTIGVGAFRNCDSIEYFEIPKSVKEIKKDTFAECKGLKEIEIPENVEVVRNNAFLDCVGLKHVVFCNPDIDVKECAFFGCINCLFEG